MIRIEIILSLICIYSLVQSSEDLSENVSINTGESATFICDLPERLSNKQAEFSGPNGRLLATVSSSEDRSRFVLEHTYAWTWSLIVSDVSDEDAGEYTCRVSSDDQRTSTIIKRFNLTVLTPPKIIDVVVESNNNEFLLENEQVILRCLVRGVPQPKILWNISGRMGQSNNNHRQDRNIISFDDKLLIKNFSRSTPINFQCIADNGIPPRDTRTRYLLPSISPEVSIQSSISRNAQQIQLSCLIVARPLTYAKWKYNRVDLNQMKRIEINEYTVQLIITLNIEPSDPSRIFGIYECIGENALKTSKSFIFIDVRCENVIVPLGNLESFLSNQTTNSLAKQQRLSSSSSTKFSSTSSSQTYAHIELLLNGSSKLAFAHSLFALFVLLCWTKISL